MLRFYCSKGSTRTLLGFLSFMSVLKLRSGEERTGKSIWYHCQHLFSVKETGTVLKYPCRITLTGTMHVSRFGCVLVGPGPPSAIFPSSYVFLLSCIARDLVMDIQEDIAYTVVTDHTFSSLSDLV